MQKVSVLSVVIVAGAFCDACKEACAALVGYVGESVDLHVQASHVKASALEW